jgi:hypothetical protein
LGRFITFTRFDNKSSNWPINSYNEFKALVELKKGSNGFSLSYNYKNMLESGSLKINLVYGENLNIMPVYLAIFVANDSKLVFDLDSESKSNGEKNDLRSAIKRVRTIGLLWQAFISENLNSYGLGRKSFRYDLNSNGGK